MSTTKETRRSPFPLWKLMLAAVILVNPAPLLLDIIPDALAYWLIVSALGQVSLINGDFEEARQQMKSVLLISVLKIPSFFVMLMIWGTSGSQRAIVAVFCTVFSLLEFIFTIPAFRRLFTCLYRLGEHYGSTEALTSGTGTWRMRPTSLEGVTVAFLGTRAVLSCLPEMCLVPMSNIGEGGYNWNALYPVAAILAALLVLIFGIVWCCYFVAYLKRVSRDRETFTHLAALCSGHERETGKGRFRQLKTVFVLYLAAIVLCFDLFLDGVNYLPDALAAIALLGATFLLFRRGAGARQVAILAMTYGIFSLGHYLVLGDFLSQYSYAAVSVSDAARGAYLQVLIVEGATQALLIATLIGLCYCLVGVSRQEVLGRLGTGDFAPIAAKTHRELRRKLSTMTLLGCLTAAASFVRSCTHLSTQTLKAGENGTVSLVTPVLDWFWIVVAVLHVAWLVLSVLHLGRLREEAEVNTEA